MFPTYKVRIYQRYLSTIIIDVYTLHLLFLFFQDLDFRYFLEMFMIRPMPSFFFFLSKTWTYDSKHFKL